jgi:hypothetical protein
MSENQTSANAVSVYGQEGLDDFPVLKAFQQYIDAEQNKSRKRMVMLCVFFGFLMTVMIMVFLFILRDVSSKNDALNDRVLEFMMKSSDRQNVIVQPPAPSNDAAIKTMTDTLPFKLEANGRNAILYYENQKEVFRPRIKSMDSQHANGYARLSLFGTARFQFNIHETPAFHDFENKRYQDTLFEVEEIDDLTYAHVPGFWSEMGDETDVTGKIFRMTDAISEVPLDLHLDIFRPQNDTLKKHPLVMLIHGGAFYFGSKDDASITRWCRHLASLGYVTASIDYRIGFLPSMASIGRAGYRAVQDAHAAMRYLVLHQQDYCIDTSMIFVGGASAGAITAPNLAFMTNEARP